MRNLIKNEQSGRSMIEMLGVLAIIGVLSVGGISGYSKAMAKFKLTKAQDQIQMLIMNIRTAFSGSSNYGGLNNKLAVSLNIVPGDMIPGGQAGASKVGSKAGLINAFAGAVVLAATGTNDGYFTLSFAGLGKDACTSLASSDWGTDGLISITVNTTTNNQSKLPLSAKDAVSQCDLTESKNKIEWQYY